MNKLSASLIAMVAALSSSVAFADTVKIGALFPMSGTNAELGAIFANGAQLAVKHINQSGRLAETVALEVEDHQALPAQGVTGMNKLVGVQGVPYVLTSFTGVSKAIAPIGNDEKVVMVNAGGVGPDLANLGDYFWNIIPLANAEMKALVPYFVKDRSLPRVALVYVDDPLGASILDVLEESVPSNGGEIVGTFPISVTMQQFSSLAATIRSAQPDVVVIASFGAQQAQLVKQLRDNGVKQQIASYSAFSLPSLLQLPEAKGSLFAVQSMEKDRGDAMTEQFFKDYVAEYNTEPGSYAINYYNAVMLFADLAEVLEKSGRELTGENLLAARIENPEHTFVGSTLSFEANGTVKAPIAIQQVDDGSSSLVTVIAD